MNTLTETQVRLFASAQSWIEGEAVRQLYATAKLNGVRLAIGFPDLHPGKGTPVGAAFATEGAIYPHLIGGGNHFAELQTVEKILDADELKKLDLGKQQLLVLVHSGSRGLGERILRAHVDQHFGDAVEAESLAAKEYLRGHDFAVRWARANRELIARRFVAALGAEAECLWDGYHNSITRCESSGETVWLHRKGAVAADGEFVVIPGSRGSLSYLVKPTGDGHSHAWSLAHGAGRKWARNETRLRMRERFGMQQLVQTPLGGRVICEERALLYEEAPAAYKNIKAVIQDLVDAGLVSVIATLRPLLTYKTRKQKR